MTTSDGPSTLRQIATRYGQMQVFANDVGAATQSLIAYGEWAQNELRLLSHLLAPGDTVLDVGAYIGTHSLAFADAVGPSGQVIAFEAQPVTFEVLSSNVASNHLDQVTLHNAVASFETGRLRIPGISATDASSFGSASLLSVFEAGAPTDALWIEVASMTIDQLSLAACRLIKIDAEGMRALVLRGADDTLRRLQPVVYAECNTLEGGLATMALLQAAGLEVLAHVVPAFNPENFHQLAENLFGEAAEVALIGCNAASRAQLAGFELRHGELLLPIETADDLALALFNKPQYGPEVLRSCAAAASGGLRCLDQIDHNRLEVERLTREAAALRESVGRERDEGVRLHEALERQMTEAGRLSRALHITNEESQAAQAQVAAMRASLSWRITRPLRLVSRLLRRGSS